MKLWRATGILLLCLVLAGATACNPLGGSDKEEISQQLVEVARGDLTVSVSGSGNIGVSREARLTFSSGGWVDKIYVEVGDVVSKGDLLARLDTSSLELARTQAQVALTQAQVGLTQAQVRLTQAQVALTQARLAQQTAEYELESTLDKKDILELALLKAQIDLRTAKHQLDETRDIYTWPDIKTAQADVDDAKAYVDYASENLDRATTAEKQALWAATLAHAQARLTAAEAKLDAMTRSYDTEEVAIAKLRVDAAEMAVPQAQKNLDKLAKEIAIKELQLDLAKDSVEQAQQSVALAQQSVALARQSLELAQQSLKEAQKNLDKATITTPFDGVVASVYVKEGDLIPAPTMGPKTVVYLIDPTSMELIVELDEIDIPEVRLNQEAIITIDALPDVELKGKVTSIYPLPTEKGGVVLYNVKINLAVPEGSNLKVGMSASADIIIKKRSNVLLVPSRAIEEDSQGKPMVKVMVNEQIQERPVVTGITDGLQTEIISGLNEGETVVIETRTKPKPSGLQLF